MEVNGLIHVPVALILSKCRRYPLNRRLGGPQTWCRRFGEEKNLLSLLGLKPWTVQPVAKSVHGLRYSGCSCTSDLLEQWIVTVELAVCKSSQQRTILQFFF